MHRLDRFGDDAVLLAFQVAPRAAGGIRSLQYALQ